MERGMKLKRGELGYLKRKKRREFINTILFTAIGITIFIIGLLLNKMELANIFTVFAVLMVLPTAKALVGVILLFPYHPIPLTDADEFTKYAKEGDIVLYDVVFTSTERAMHLDCIYITNHQIIGISGHEKDKLDIIKTYFEKALKEHKLSYVVFLTKDKDALRKRMELRQDSDSNNTDSQQEVYQLLQSFIV